MKYFIILLMELMNNHSGFLLLFMRIFGSVMVLVYAGAGLAFLLVPGFVSGITGYPRYGMGILLILYAFFRGYRVFNPN